MSKKPPNQLSFPERERRRTFIEVLFKILSDEAYQEEKKLYFKSERQVFLYMYNRASFRCPFKNKNQEQAYNSYIQYKVKYHPELQVGYF